MPDASSFRCASAEVQDDICPGNLDRVGLAACLVLELALVDSALGDYEPVRITDEVRIGKLEARPLRAVVEHDLEARIAELSIEGLGGLADAH
jgi:hypothetical protein